MHSRRRRASATTSFGASTAASPTDPERSTAATWKNWRAQPWIEQLAHAQPMPVAGALLLVFIISVVLTSKTVAGDHCKPTDDRLLQSDGFGVVLFEATVSGAALGCMLSAIVVAAVLRVLRGPRTVLRLETLFVGAVIYVEMGVFYHYSATDALARVCVSPLGGLLSSRRSAVIPLRYIFWACATPPMVAMLGKLAGASPYHVRLAVLADMGTMLFGLAASLIQSSVLIWLLFLSLSFSLNAFVIRCHLEYLRGARAASCDALTRRLLTVLGPASVGLWMTFPVWWCVAELGLASAATVRLGWPLLDMVAKSVFVVQMTAGDFSSALAEADASLLRIDAERRAGDATATARRETIRYLFHELRVPLNSIVLAAEELVDLDSCASSSSPEEPPQEGEGTTQWAREMGDIIARSASAMALLLNDYQSLQQVGTPPLGTAAELELQPVHIRQLVEESVDIFSAPLEQRSLGAVIRIDPLLPEHVIGDPHR